MQLILQATHGVVSGQPTFFKRAFGDSYEDFERILIRPHHYVFNRDWYENRDGRAEFDEFSAQFDRLTNTDKEELLGLLSSTDPRNYHKLKSQAESQNVERILEFYLPLDKSEEAKIWNTPKEDVTVPDDERVEDAGLNDEPSEAAIESASHYAEITV
jgi:hypothetical protein